jgi:photosystem II stability/assembly factor-like uncharacterized protein
MTRKACLSPNGVNGYLLDGLPLSVFIATLDGVIELGRAATGDSWRVARHKLKGHHVGSLMMEPLGGTLFAGTHGTGLYRSRDEGQTWEPVTRGLASPHIFTLAYDVRGENVTLYAGTEPARLFKSGDLGDHWEELAGVTAVAGREKWNFPAPPHIAHVKHVVADPRTPATLYVCVEQGALLKSEDGGATFRELMFEDEACILNKDVHRIVFNPTNADEIYVDGGDGIFRSHDAGAKWERVADTKLRVAYPDQLFFDPDVADTLFVVGGGSPPGVWRQIGNANPAIIRSQDYGRSWHQLSKGMPNSFAGNFEAASMLQWPGGYGFMIGTSDGEVYASFDKGESWSEVANDISPLSKSNHFRNIANGRATVAAR